jgi:hypothetical protein
MKPKKKSAKAKPVVKIGRPSKRTDEIVKRIIEGLSAGTPLTVICSTEDMPAPRTVSDWASNDKELSACIARARDTGFDAIASRLRDTARGGGDSTGDYQRDKLIIDTDLKLLAKWDPKRYGDKIAQEISGPDGGAIKTETMALTPDQESSLAQVIEDARARVRK